MTYLRRDLVSAFATSIGAKSPILSTTLKISVGRGKLAMVQFDTCRLNIADHFMAADPYVIRTISETTMYSRIAFSPLQRSPTHA